MSKRRITIEFTETTDCVFDQFVTDEELDHIEDRVQIGDFDEIKKRSVVVDGNIDFDRINYFQQEK